MLRLYYGLSSASVPIKKRIHTTGWKPTQLEAFNNFEGVTMTVKEGTASSTGLTVLFSNSSDSRCIYGQEYCLEKKIDEKWYQVPVAIKGSYAFETIGYNLTPGESREPVINWEWLYGSLGMGEYRIVKGISNFRVTGDYDTYSLAAEFSI